MKKKTLLRRISNKIKKLYWMHLPIKAPTLPFNEIKVSLYTEAEVKEYEKNQLPKFREIEKHVLKFERIAIHCSICEKKTNSLVRSSVFYGNNPSLREGIICTSCKMNARSRLVYEYLLYYANQSSTVYLNEQHTKFANCVTRKFPNTICSSFSTNLALSSGQTFSVKDKEYRFEDFTKTSFDQNYFDCIVTCDVLEHVPSFECALKESFRILKPGGKLLLQVPVFGGINDHITRAVIESGNIRHILKPEIHGDPNSREGILAFYNFSYKLISNLKEAGFSQVTSEVYYSTSKGYFTDNNPRGNPYPTESNWGLMLPVVICAIK